MSDTIRIVILDDSEIMANVARLQLETVGFDVRVATDLVAFEQVLRSFSPQIILSDVNMPEAPGDEVCRVLKGKMETQSVPIILYSTIPESELEERASRAGADGWVSKGAGPAALKERVLGLLDEIVF